MQINFILLNVILFCLAWLIFSGVAYLPEGEILQIVTGSFSICFVVTAILSGATFYLIFGKKILLLELSKYQHLDQARYILLITGIVQVGFPLVPSDGPFLFLELGFGIFLLAAYFSKSVWASIAVLALYSIYIVGQNVQYRGLVPATPFIIAACYEGYFLFRMARLNIARR